MAYDDLKYGTPHRWFQRFNAVHGDATTNPYVIGMGNEGRRATYAQMAGTPPATKPSQASPVVQKALESSGYFPQGNNPDESNLRFGSSNGMTPQERNVAAPAAPRRGTYEWAQEIARTGGVDPSNPLSGGGAPMRSYQEQLANVQRMNAMSDLKEAIDRTGTRPVGGIYANSDSIGAMMRRRADRQAQAGHAALLRDYAKLTSDQGLMAQELGIKDTASLRDMMGRLGVANIEAGSRRDVAGMGLEGTKYGADVELEKGRMSSTAALLGTEARARAGAAGRQGRETLDMERAQTQRFINNLTRGLSSGVITTPDGKTVAITPQQRQEFIMILRHLQKSSPSVFDTMQMMEPE